VLAVAWLLQVKKTETKDSIIATYASPDFPDELKRRIAETIKQRKNE
jgi:hypothetical protein